MHLGLLPSLPNPLPYFTSAMLHCLFILLLSALSVFACTTHCAYQASTPFTLFSENDFVYGENICFPQDFEPAYPYPLISSNVTVGEFIKCLNNLTRILITIDEPGVAIFSAPWGSSADDHHSSTTAVSDCLRQTEINYIWSDLDYDEDLEKEAEGYGMREIAPLDFVPNRWHWD